MSLCWGFGFARHVRSLGGETATREQVVEGLCEWLVDEAENEDRAAHAALLDDARAAGLANSFLVVS